MNVSYSPDIFFGLILGFLKSKRKIKESSYFDLIMITLVLPCFFWQSLNIISWRKGQKISADFKSKSGKNTVHFYCSQITIHRLLFTDYYSWITVHRLVFTDTVHFLLFITLFTPKFCLFKGGCPLSLRQNST